MTKKQLQYGILFFTLLIDMLAFGIVVPVLPRYAEHLGATSLEIGLLVGVFSLAQSITFPFWGHLSDYIGRKPVLLISVCSTVCGYLLMGATHSIFIMTIARIIDGAAGGNISVIQASISDITKPEERSWAFGFLGAAYGVSCIFGPSVGGWASNHYGFSAPMFIAAGLAVVNMLLIMISFPESRKQKGERISKRPSLFTLLEHLDRKVYIPVFVTFFFFIISFAIMTTLLALFVYHRYNMNEQQTGYIYAMIGLISIIIEGGLFGFLTKYFSCRLLVITGTTLMGCTLFLFPWTHNIGGIIGVCAMMALGDSFLSPALPSIISCSVENEWQGAAFGVFQ
ncbi:MAG: hypothetical protein A3F67_07210 [Verrucomicrobia bacterium RIFCSPHIGHO2_12_FULL_41_10]|nr:MAG: hypothetical protein A3F67_07210 [Verrucomicrobia bacterium RIFCSPHIGHO2_12_FULL_41_10]HLB34256.1 MFS transporter [Chthoniobacterales bacterium]